jgi:hypothetical protein
VTQFSTTHVLLTKASYVVMPKFISNAVLLHLVSVRKDALSVSNQKLLLNTQNRNKHEWSLSQTPDNLGSQL